MNWLYALNNFKQWEIDFLDYWIQNIAYKKSKKNRSFAFNIYQITKIYLMYFKRVFLKILKIVDMLAASSNFILRNIFIFFQGECFKELDYGLFVCLKFLLFFFCTKRWIILCGHRHVARMLYVKCERGWRFYWLQGRW